MLLRVVIFILFDKLLDDHLFSVSVLGGYSNDAFLIINELVIIVSLILTFCSPFVDVMLHVIEV